MSVTQEKNVLKIGITGQEGFIGKHVYNTLGLYPQRFVRVAFNKSYLDKDELLDQFVNQCDVIIHLAGVNRNPDPEKIYFDNIHITKKLIASLKRCKSSAHVLFSSSIQESEDNPYGKSKKQARLLLAEWATYSSGRFTGLLIPNVFGPFCEPFYNSVVATFCYQLTHGQEPKISVDKVLQLIYVNDLAAEILLAILEKNNDYTYYVKPTTSVSVSQILKLLHKFKDEYLGNGAIPVLQDRFALDLFNTFRSYIDLKARYPVNFEVHTDPRGDFAEIIRLGKGVNGQVSFSITLPGATRGNHFHTRKIERFAVINGEARIQMRRLGTDEVFEFSLSGTTPSYVDMPVWTIHNITNIGSTPLYTIFWINEPYESEDPDTYFEVV